MAVLKRSRPSEELASHPHKRTRQSGPAAPLTSRALRTVQLSPSPPETPPPASFLPLKSLSLSPSPSLQSSLRRFARHGGPDLSDLRGLVQHRMMDPRRNSKHGSGRGSGRGSSRLPQSETGSTPAHVALTPLSTIGSTTTKVTVGQFESRLAESHIYLPQYRHAGGRSCPAPQNLDDIKARLQAPRPSLSPSRFSESHFNTFCKEDARVVSESSVMCEVVYLIHGRKDFESAQNLQFTNITPFTQGLPKPKPDLYDGALSGEIAKPVLNKLEHTVIPTKYAKAPIAPNFFLEAKGPLRAPLELRSQITNDLGVGVRAMNSLQNYGQPQPVYDGNAYAMGSTYHAGSGSLHIYTGHMTQSPKGNLETHITQVRGFALTDSAEVFRNGLGAFRNARDLAKEYRDELLQEANRQSVGDLSSSDDEVDGRNSKGKGTEAARTSNRKRATSPLQSRVRKRQGK